MGIWEFPKIWGTLFWGPYDKDPTIQGTILGSPIFGNSHIEVQDCVVHDVMDGVVVAMVGSEQPRVFVVVLFVSAVLRPLNGVEVAVAVVVVAVVVVVVVVVTVVVVVVGVAVVVVVVVVVGAPPPTNHPPHILL